MDIFGIDCLVTFRAPIPIHEGRGVFQQFYILYGIWSTY